jgi:penicillin amidase
VQLSLNYTVLSLRAPLAKIEPWTIVDTLTWYHAMAWQLRGEDEELTRVRVLGGVKDLDRMQGLYPGYPYDRHQPVLSAATAARLLPLSGAAGTQTSAASGAGQSRSTAGSGPTKSGKVRRPSKKVPAKGVGAAGAAAPAIPGVTAAQARQLDADSVALKRALTGVDAQAVVDQARGPSPRHPTIPGGAWGANAGGLGATQTGAPLADDPQLHRCLAGAWHQMGAAGRCPTAFRSTSGFTFAGACIASPQRGSRGG